MENFDGLGLAPQVLDNITRMGLTRPTPIQAEAIPHVVKGRDLLGLAQTGTGKTAAFGLPMVTRLIAFGRKPAAKQVRALILAPTRELATQIADNVMAFADGSPIRVFRVVGGASINTQIERLKRGVDVLIATPGRLIDLLDRGAVDLTETRYLVLDEADQMLDIGFIHALRRIARHVPKDRQTLLFSATMPKLMEELAESYLSEPVRVAVNPPGQAADKIVQGVHFVNQGDKAKLLSDYIAAHPGERAVVFGRTKHGSEKLTRLLESWGFKVGAIHGNKSQNQRERTLQDFRQAEIEVLVATDVAARGLDIPDVKHVYNYDLPNVPDQYVHRIGRTARAGKDGRAVAFCAPAELADLRAIEKMLKGPITVIGGDAPAAPAPGSRPARPGPSRKDLPRQGRPGQGAGQGAGQARQGGRGQGAAKPAPGTEAPKRKRPARRPSRKPKGQQAAEG